MPASSATRSVSPILGNTDAITRMIQRLKSGARNAGMPHTTAAKTNSPAKVAKTVPDCTMPPALVAHPVRARAPVTTQAQYGRPM